MGKNLATFNKHKVQVVAIATDESEDNRDFAKENNLGFPLLSDDKRQVIKAYGVYDKGNDTAWPAVFVIGKGGKITWRFVGTSYKKRPPVKDILGALGVK